MVYITGDIHGSLEPIYDMFAKYHPNKDDIIVILGDVGVNYTGTLQDIEEAECIIMNGVSHTVPLPKTDEMLKVLKDVGIRTGVVSNLCWSGNALTRRLQEAFPEHHFDFVITSSEYIFRKPDVHIFDMAVRKSGLDKTDIWYCGNNKEADIIGSHEAGLFPVFYDDRSVPSRLHERNDKISVNFPYLHLSSWDDLINAIMQ